MVSEKEPKSDVANKWVSGNFNESLLRKAANIAQSFNRSNTNSTAGVSLVLLKFNSK